MMKWFRSFPSARKANQPLNVKYEKTSGAAAKDGALAPPQPPMKINRHISAAPAQLLFKDILAPVLPPRPMKSKP